MNFSTYLWRVFGDYLDYLNESMKAQPKTQLVADEVVRVYTVEITEVCKRDETNGEIELNDGESKLLCKLLEDALKDRLNADDAHVVKFQQFITKAHEEEVK